MYSTYKISCIYINIKIIQSINIIIEYKTIYTFVDNTYQCIDDNTYQCIDDFINTLYIHTIYIYIYIYPLYIYMYISTLCI